MPEKILYPVKNKQTKMSYSQRVLFPGSLGLVLLPPVLAVRTPITGPGLAAQGHTEQRQNRARAPASICRGGEEEEGLIVT